MNEVREVMAEAFVKNDSDKRCRPTLIPVEFRNGLRLAPRFIKAVASTWDDVLDPVAAYEAGHGALSFDGCHRLVTAASHLQRLYEDGTGESFLYGVARIMDMGAKKYSENNWRKCPYEDRHRYLDAFYRHVWVYQADDDTDDESQENHLLHAGCCLLMLHGIDIAHHNGDKK